MFQPTNHSNTKEIPKWVQYRSVGYLTGRGIHFGSADGKIFPQRAFIDGRFCIGVDQRNNEDVDIVGTTFNGLEDRFFDWVFLGPQLKAHPQPEQLIKQSLKKLKGDGHLILCVPTSVNYHKLIHGYSWIHKDECINRDGFHWIALKKAHGKPGITITSNSKGCKNGNCKRACIVRYGALGDQVVISPLVKKLKEDGYHVTINSHVDTGIVLRGSPYVDNIVGQERDAIFNPELKGYWEEWASQYDKYINLSESVEASLLKTEGFRDYYTTKEFRHNQCNVNYYDRTMALGGYPEVIGTLPELYFSDKEEKRCQKFVNNLRTNGIKKVILWLLKGSSHHKHYTLTPIVVDKLLREHPDWVVCISGGHDALPYKFEHPSGRVIDLVHVMPPRDIMCLTGKVDLVVGPETGMMNAAAAFDTPKVVMLSHSTIENLTKYWTNTISLEPPKDLTPCYPCHQLHYTLESCPLAELKSNDKVMSKDPLCAVTIPTESVINAINSFVT